MAKGKEIRPNIFNKISSSIIQFKFFISIKPVASLLA